MSGERAEQWSSADAYVLQSQAVLEVEHGIVLLNETARLAHVNPAAALILRMNPGQCRQEDFVAALEELRMRSAHPDSIAVDLYRLLADADGRVSKWLWHLIDPSVHLHVSIAPLRGESIHGRVWVFHDVSEVFDAWHRVGKLEHRLRQLLTEGDVIAFRLRRGGVFEWVSPSTVRMMGFPEEVYMGRNAAELCDPADVPNFYQTVKQLRRTGEPQYIGIRVSDASGRLRNLEGRMFLAHDDHESLEVILSDVTSHVELEQMRVTLASIASHEIKTPLAFMTTGLAMLEDGTIDTTTDSGREVVDRMHAAAVRLARMSNDLLSLQKLEITRVPVADDEIPIYATVQQAVEMVAVERGVSTAIEDSSSSARRCVDSDLLQQAVINLVSNAIRHSPDQATVDIHVGVAGDEVSIRVRDRGPGIPLESRQVVFQPFVRLQADRSGAGLGLAIVERIAKLHRGSVSVQDPDDGVGSIFVLKLLDLGGHV